MDHWYHVIRSFNSSIFLKIIFVAKMYLIIIYPFVKRIIYEDDVVNLQLALIIFCPVPCIKEFLL